MSSLLNPRTAICIIRSEPWGLERLYSVQATPDITQDVRRSALHTREIDEVLRVVAAFLQTSGAQPVSPREAGDAIQDRLFGGGDGAVTTES